MNRTLLYDNLVPDYFFILFGSSCSGFLFLFYFLFLFFSRFSLISLSFHQVIVGRKLPKRCLLSVERTLCEVTLKSLTGQISWRPLQDGIGRIILCGGHFYPHCVRLQWQWPEGVRRYSFGRKCEIEMNERNNSL